MKKSKVNMRRNTSKLVIVMCCCLLVLAASGCGKNEDNKSENNKNNDSKAVYEQISQEEAKKLMDSEADEIILDVRTEEEYSSGHIVGAVCIPNETIDNSVTEQLPDKEQLILVYCRSGNRSKQASEKLAGMGYTNIKEFGGINTWEYETE